MCVLKTGFHRDMLNGMKKGYLITNGFMQSAKFLALYDALSAAAQRQGLSLERRTNAGLLPCITKREPTDGFAVFWDKDVRLGYALENNGMRLFNSARAIELCDDKAATHLALCGRLPMPDTLLVPFCFPGVGEPDFSFAVEAAERLGFPMVIKECFGSFGKQVYLVNDMRQMYETLERVRGVAAIMQRYVAESRGKDVRIYVVGDHVAAAICRKNQHGGFLANVAAGGMAVPHTPTAEEERMALEAARLLGLDFCGVDLLFGRDGPLLIEVNSNAHFAAISETTGVDVPGEIIAHVKQCVCNME